MICRSAATICHLSEPNEQPMRPSCSCMLRRVACLLSHSFCKYSLSIVYWICITCFARTDSVVYKNRELCLSEERRHSMRQREHLPRVHDCSKLRPKGAWHWTQTLTSASPFAYLMRYTLFWQRFSLIINQRKMCPVVGAWSHCSTSTSPQSSRKPWWPWAREHRVCLVGGLVWLWLSWASFWVFGCLYWAWGLAN